MRHPENGAQHMGASETAVSVSRRGRHPEAGHRGGRLPWAAAGPPQAPGPPQAAPAEPGLPPGQYIPSGWPVLHYGPVPVFRPDTWDLCVLGATESRGEHRWNWAELAALPRCRVVADLHCVTRFTVPGIAWEGIPAAAILRAAPPDAAVTHVMVWADFGYSANLPITDFAAADTLLATHRDGAELSPEHGYPLRLVVPLRYAWKSVKWVRAVEYLTRDRRGFWEERGYHNTADPSREQRYSYQELPGEGPPP